MSIILATVLGYLIVGIIATVVLFANKNNRKALNAMCYLTGVGYLQVFFESVVFWLPTLIRYWNNLNKRK